MSEIIQIKFNFANTTVLYFRVKRGGSTGFALNEDSFDDNFLENSLNQEKEWIDKFRSKQSSVLNRKESNRSSEYSFSTDYR